MNKLALMYPPKPGKWTNASTDTQATVVTAEGKKSTGRVVCWIGPGECEIDTGARGLLFETWQRRQAAES